MKRRKNLFNVCILLIILAICFVVSLFLHKFDHDALIPAVFVLGTFLTSAVTSGYLFGIMSSLISVLAVNFAFTFPFFQFNFSAAGNLISAIIMLVVALLTCGLTAQIKRQEYIQAESEKERMRANLMRAVSHDLKTPLTTICGAGSALLENGQNFSEEQIKSLLQGICEDSQWLSRMVENLLSVTRLENGQLEIIKTPTVLDELVDSVLVKFKFRYPEQKVTLDIPDEFVTIPMDALLIEQVAINILENAVQHALDMTELIFRVYIKGKNAIFEIQDNGQGIPEGKIKNVFSGFYTEEDMPTDGKKKNSGIGLSVCATIIKAHGGTIHAMNVKTGGAKFTFTLEMGEE